MNKKITTLSFSIILLVIAMFAIVSCKDDDDGDDSVEFKLPKTELNFAAEGGTQNISVQGEDVTATSTADWLTVKQESVSGKIFKFSFIATENLTGETRTTTVKVTSKSGSGEVTVTQVSGDFITVDKTDATFTKDGGKLEVKVTATKGYTINISGSFITKSASKSATENTEVFDIASSSLPTGRSGKITFKLEGLDLSAEINVIQEAGIVQQIAENITAFDVAKNMYPGWNLGNTMEASDGETSWQHTLTTSEIIHFIKEQGFKSVRIPCSWFIHSTQSGDYTIDEKWMARVTEIVNYCIDEDLYVLLNDHWDNDWIEESGFKNVTEEKITANCDIMKKLWTQIAVNFAGYDEHLIFAGMNEPFQGDNNSQGNKTNTLIRYEQAFIDAVRATGGNNEKRILTVQGPATDIATTLSYYDVTQLKDVADGLLMVEVHYYAPWNFCGMEENESWGNVFYYWGTENHISSSKYNANWGELDDWLLPKFKSMKEKFADKGYPIIIGEYAAQWRNLSNVSGESQEKHDASIKAFYKAVSQYGPSNGMIPMVWDINYCNQNGSKGVMTLIDRDKLSIYNEPAMEGIKEGNALAVWPY